MIHTIGYQAFSLDLVLTIMKESNIDILVDVRSWPFSRNPMKQEFNRNRLEETLGQSYIWLGPICGGKNGPVKAACISKLTKLVSAGHHLLLMCMEAQPKDCHRYYDISKQLEECKIHVHHIVNTHCGIEILSTKGVET